MKTLRLVLMKKWFDLIASGKKSEEYRDISPYWTSRLHGKVFDAVEFRNGYGAKSPSVTREFKSCTIGMGYEALGAPGRVVYIISLGKIIEAKNYQPVKDATPDALLGAVVEKQRKDAMSGDIFEQFGNMDK